VFLLSMTYWLPVGTLSWRLRLDFCEAALPVVPPFGRHDRCETSQGDDNGNG
jgi:hypothetical protein